MPTPHKREKIKAKKEEQKINKYITTSYDVVILEYCVFKYSLYETI